ncbi:Uncharacterized protein APZ42_008885 [Daphnia magna]|uniref:Uncharacterized protein n=1 Tax=Daphnia magna TaxID=35525 RepID=A0A162CZP0_9CRUS|nr:Uncharacterized protein APZ42_008885 [Daphnia magna]
MLYFSASLETHGNLCFLGTAAMEGNPYRQDCWTSRIRLREISDKKVAGHDNRVHSFHHRNNMEEA